MQQQYEVRGSVETIIFRNEENGYTVLELASDAELVTVTGEFPDIAIGEMLVVIGTYTTHAKYGQQLRMLTYQREMPATAAAIASYLASGVLHGVGPAMAARLVEAFGDDTLTVIEQQPQRLTEIRGISEKKAKQICEEYQKLGGMRTVMLYLTSVGISAIHAIKIYKLFGNAAQERIEENPYVLCGEEIGIDFETADNIALKGGIQPNDMRRTQAAVLHVLRHNMTNGHICLPRDKTAMTTAKLLESDSYAVDDMIEELVLGEELVDLKIGGQSFLYLPRCYEAECYIASKFALMLQNEPAETPQDANAQIDTHEARLGITYNDLQRQAIFTAITQEIMILTGGPGTGKTTTISAIIDILTQRGEKVALAAPTGRAAKRMADLTGVEAKTVHRLLEVDFTSSSDTMKFKRGEKNPLPYDAIIIDEMSMMDTLLFESLLRAVKFACRLILVGDPDQLPPVGAGDVLGDLIKSEKVPVVHLSEIFRQAAQSLIVTNAHDIIAGNLPVLDRRDNDFFYLPQRSAQNIALLTADLCARRLPNSYQFSPLWDIQVIAPTRIGAAGTTELNRVLQQALNPPDPSKKEFSAGSTTFREGDKVMQIRNNYDLIWERENGEDGMGIFNGDIGIIEMINRPSSSILIRFEDRVAEYSFDMAGELELAYAITVHKSQGNEYAAVILPLMEGRSRMHYRSLLYTAVTRARKLLIIVGSQQAIGAMVANHKRTRRYTNLVHLLGEVC